MYTGADGDGLFLNYKTSTIIAAAFVVLVFIILLILIGLEIRRMKKEDTLQIILEDKTADEKCKNCLRDRNSMHTGELHLSLLSLWALLI